MGTAAQPSIGRKNSLFGNFRRFELQQDICRGAEVEGEAGFYDDRHMRGERCTGAFVSPSPETIKGSTREPFETQSIRQD